MAILKLWHLILFLSVVIIASADKPKEQLSDETNIKLKAIQTLLDSKNGSPLARVATARNSTDFEQELENLFEQVLNGKWENAAVLLQFASLTPDASVKLIIYKVLWRHIQTSGMLRNPFAAIEIYIELQANLANHSPPLSAADQQLFAQLQQVILDAIIARSAQILEAPFHASNTNCSCEFPVPERLLQALQQLPVNVFSQILDIIYDNIADIETPKNIALTLAIFPPNTTQSVVANLNYANRSNFEAPGGQLVNATLRDNLLSLKQRADYPYVADDLQEKVNDFLELNGKVWSLPRLGCIRNATANDLYLIEPSNSFNLAIQSSSITSPVYRIERSANITYKFSSIAWSNRTITQSDYNTSAMPAVIKNVIGAARPDSYWIVLREQYGLVSILDLKREYYLCAGSPQFFENNNIYAYTRRSDTVHNYKHECQWKIDNCE